MKITKKKKRKNNTSVILPIKSAEILDGDAVGMSIIDKKMRVCWQNSVMQNWFGTIKKDDENFCYNIYRQRKTLCPRCPARQVFKKGRMHKTLQCGITKEGNRKYYQLLVTPIKDKNGKVNRALEVVLDITKTKKEDEARKELVARLKRMCSHLMEANESLQSNIHFLKHTNKKIKTLNTTLVKKYRAQTSQLKFMKEEISDLSKISKSMSSSLDLSKTLFLIVKHASTIIHADGCLLRLVNKSDNSLISKASTGISNKYLKATPLRIGEGIAGQVAITATPILIGDITKDPRVKYTTQLKKEGIYAVMSIPAIFKNDVLGVITVYFRTAREFTRDEIQLLTNFASHAAIAIEETHMYQDIHVNYFNTIHALVLAMEAKDPYTKGHSERVTQYSVGLAKRLIIPKKRITVLEFSSKVHDVGKIGISDLILNKPGKLSVAERALIELHPIKGAEMLAPLKFLELGIPWVKHHHERFDGKGYPDGLKADQIPLEARIITCADSFDAMTSERPYRYRKMSFTEALNELKTNAGTQFDPKLVNVFAEMFE